jgi:multidrug efflux pump subunit AcrA (membrane-fusion protein)
MSAKAIPAPIQTLLDLFTTCLADVRFADVDGQTLARCAADVEAAAETVATAQLTLEATREALQEKQDALLQQAQRALAYARVYAESDEVLSGRLEAVSLPRAARRSRVEDGLVLSSASPLPTPRPRGRPRKPRVAEPTLEGIGPAAE